MKTITFSSWLVQAFKLANKRPLLWLGSVLFLAVLLTLGRISLALGILLSVTSLFIGVAIVDSIHRGAESFSRALQKHFPLAITLAIILMVFWFVFRVVANFYSGETEKIIQFFFHWELTEENLRGKVFRQLFVWFYSSAIVTLIFVLLMLRNVHEITSTTSLSFYPSSALWQQLRSLLCACCHALKTNKSPTPVAKLIPCAFLTSFGSWFSYPLMAFKHCSWSEARDLGKQAVTENTGAMYKLVAFLLLTAFVGISLVPLLTPLFYMLVSPLMYVSFNDIFVEK